MCSYPQSDNALTHWKRVMICCTKCPSVNITDQETYDQYPDTTLSISFHIYHLIARCPTHGRLPLNDNCFVAIVNRIMLQKNPHKYTLEKS